MWTQFFRSFSAPLVALGPGLLQLFSMTHVEYGPLKLGTPEDDARAIAEDQRRAMQDLGNVARSYYPPECFR